MYRIQKKARKRLSPTRQEASDELFEINKKNVLNLSMFEETLKRLFKSFE